MAEMVIFAILGVLVGILYYLFLKWLLDYLHDANQH